MTTSASPRSTRKVFFPPAKKVSFVPIDEEIVTHTYVARHIDLSSSEDESNSDSSRDREATEPIRKTDEGSKKVELKVAPMVDDERAGREEGRGRQNVQRLPSSQRSKRKKRRWEWTIENLDKTEGEALIQAQKSNEIEQESSEQLDMTSPAEGSDTQAVIDISPQGSGYGAGLDASSQNDPAASEITTTPKDDPPRSPWLNL